MISDPTQGGGPIDDGRGYYENSGYVNMQEKEL